MRFCFPATRRSTVVLPNLDKNFTWRFILWRFINLLRYFVTSLLTSCVISKYLHQKFYLYLWRFKGSALNIIEVSRTSLASKTSSRTHFQVWALCHEACKSSKMSCPRLEDSIIFWLVKKKKTKDNISDSLSICCSFSFFEKIIQCDSLLSQVKAKLILNGIEWKP